MRLISLIVLLFGTAADLCGVRVAILDLWAVFVSCSRKIALVLFPRKLQNYQLIHCHVRSLWACRYSMVVGFIFCRTYHQLRVQIIDFHFTLVRIRNVSQIKLFLNWEIGFLTYFHLFTFHLRNIIIKQILARTLFQL